jgi:hypothetical protein
VEKNSPVAVRALAKKLYDAERAKLGGTAPILPASAKKAAAKKTGLPLSRLASLVDPVYFAENGKANPLPASAAKSARSLASAVRKRRDGGGTLGRWETVRASAEATLGRPISEASVRALYAKGREPPRRRRAKTRRSRSRPRSASSAPYAPRERVGPSGSALFLSSGTPEGRAQASATKITIQP